MEFALAAVEADVLARLDDEQRAALYALLHQATAGAGDPCRDDTPPDC
jgi:hypothetical protein